MDQDLQAILAARERRAEIQTELLAQRPAALLCFTMNIPGRNKDSSLIRLAFRAGVERILREFPEADHRLTRFAAGGPEAFFLLGQDAETVKELAVGIEESSPVGRLYDLDVFEPDGKKLSRGNPRVCLICGRPTAVCTREAAHTVDEARQAADRLLRQFAAEKLAEEAVESLKEEVRLTPKPGLVDLESNGAHEDMSPDLFFRSMDAIRPYFREAAVLGMERENTMPELQEAGLRAEAAMFSATGGVNTHKGAIYAFGLMLSALGSCLALGAEPFSTAASLAASGTAPGGDTHGGQVRKKYPRSGARQEALEGFPNALSAYNVLLETGNPHKALLWLMASVPDSNLLYRGGADGLTYVQEQSKRILMTDPPDLAATLRDLDREMTKRRLSPGGCADLLALALFLQKTEPIWNEE